MFSELSAKIIQNKNLLMLLTVGIYILALFSVFSGHLFAISFLITIFFLFCIIKSYFPLKYIIIWSVVFYLGVLNTLFRIKDVDELLSYAPINCRISGTIVSIPQGKAEGKPKFFFVATKLVVGMVEKNLDSEKVLVTVNSDDKSENLEGLKLYNSYEFTGRLSTPFKAGNPSQFDYGNYLRNHNTYAVFYANSYEQKESVPDLKSKFLQRISDYRENILKIHSKYLPSPNLEILGGIVFGDDAVSPPKDIKQSFVNSGLLHILAASGMNVAFIYVFFYMFMSIFRINFKLKVVLGMITVVIYSLMTGLGASVIRATAMLLFVLIGKLIDRDAHSVSLLSFVGLLMLVYNPMYLNDVGFQLSFIVTLGILLMAPLVLRFENKFLDFLASTVTIPIISQLWVIPIQIFYFNNISLYSVFANIMSVPILMVLSFGGFISSLLSLITPIADFVCKTFDFILNPLITILVNISDFWGHLPNSALQTTHPSIFQLILYYSILLILTFLLRKEYRERYLKPMLVSILSLFIVLLLTLIPIKNSNLEIMTFDVGNADSFLIKTPSNDYLMIDTGKSGYKGGKSQAEIIMLKYLKDKGIKSFDSLIITHFDNDHCGGAVDVLKNIKVKLTYVNDLKHKSFAANNIYKAVKETGTKLVLAENGQVVYDKDGLKMINLLAESSDSDNENSIITLLTYKDFLILFTGDAGVKGLKDVLNSIPQNITVLKVPHHGAIGGLDKSLIEYFNPKYSIISVGENKFGHPAVYTLELLKKSEILRTDINNSVLLKLKDSDLKIYSYDTFKRRYFNVTKY